MALWIGSISFSETSVRAVSAACKQQATEMDSNAALTAPIVPKGRYRMLRSYSALNSHPISAMNDITYIQTTRAIAAPTDPYITL